MAEASVNSDPILYYALGLAEELAEELSRHCSDPLHLMQVGLVRALRKKMERDADS
jgi:hypothetical protein